MAPTMQEKPRGPLSSALAEVELAVFLLDGSGSMCNPDEGAAQTYDGRTKAEHLIEIMRATLTTMRDSPSKKESFRVALIYFAQEATAEKVQVDGAEMTYFRPDAALKALKMPCEITGGGKTSIVAALAKAREVLDAAYVDEGLPADKKFATVFLLTDGQENIQTAQEVHEEIGKLRSHPISPVIAVVSFGIDADDALLLEVANEPTERQVRHLEVAGLLGEISQEPRKLFLKGHSGGTVTKDQAVVIRTFLNVLSDSIALGQEKVAKG